jgi:hypothetical protein
MAARPPGGDPPPPPPRLPRGTAAVLLYGSGAIDGPSGEGWGVTLEAPNHRTAGEASGKSAGFKGFGGGEGSPTPGGRPPKRDSRQHPACDLTLFLKNPGGRPCRP